MQLAEKQELIRLLNLYQADLLIDNDSNIREAAKHPEKKWEGTYKTGVKAQYEHASLLERLKARIEESAIKVSTVKAPHTYMKAVGTRELEKILEEELGNEDTKRHTC